MDQVKEPIYFKYNGSGIDGPELPLDFSENAFIQHLLQKEIKINKDVLRTTLRQFSQNSPNGSDNDFISIHDDIYRNDDLRAQKRSGKEAFSFFYETLDLLDAIAAARSKAGKASIDEIARQAVEELGTTLSGKDPACIHLDYPSTILLSDTAMQRSMNMRFDTELRQRLTEIWDLIHKAKTEYMPGLLTSTLTKLDMILTSLRDPEISINNRNKPISDLDLINTLYSRIIKHRQFIRRPLATNEDVRTDKVLHFVLKNTPENDSLLDDFEVMLRKRSSGYSKEELMKLERLYNQYLIASTVPESSYTKRIRKAELFLENYQILQNYVRHTTDRADFEQQVRKELHKFARNLFLYYDHTAPTAASPFDMVFTHVDSTFAYSLINDFYTSTSYHFQHILRTLHEARIIELLLRQKIGPEGIRPEFLPEESSLQHLSNDLADGLTYYIIEIRTMRSILHKAFKDLPLLRDFSDSNIEDYVNAYNQSCIQIFHTKQIDIESIKQRIRTHLPPLPYRSKSLIAQMTALECFLREEMQIVVAELIERQVKIILSRV